MRIFETPYISRVHLRRPDDAPTTGHVDGKAFPLFCRRGCRTDPVDGPAHRGQDYTADKITSARHTILICWSSGTHNLLFPVPPDRPARLTTIHHASLITYARTCAPYFSWVIQFHEGCNALGETDRERGRETASFSNRFICMYTRGSRPKHTHTRDLRVAVKPQKLFFHRRGAFSLPALSREGEAAAAGASANAVLIPLECARVATGNAHACSRLSSTLAPADDESGSEPAIGGISAFVDDAC